MMLDFPVTEVSTTSCSIFIQNPKTVIDLSAVFSGTRFFFIGTQKDALNWIEGKQSLEFFYEYEDLLKEAKSRKK